jgi:tetratricopeptide (TPR) repeat protein
MKKQMASRSVTFAAVAFAMCFLGAAGAGRAAPAAAEPENVKRFEEKMQQVQRNPGGIQESVVMDLLGLGQEVGQPYAASVAVNQYLNLHLDASPELLLQAARCATAAGDLRMAVTRYKNYLKQAKGAEAADAAAELFALQIDFLGAGDDAYRMMSEQGDALRGSVKAKKFDAWCLDTARNLKDYAGFLKRLTLVLNDKLPIEQERLIYWDHLDWMIAAMGSPRDEFIKLLPGFEALIPLIRDDAARTARAQFSAANLTFEARGQAVDPDARKTNFMKVVAAAKAYVDAAPTAATVTDIFTVFGGGSLAFDFARYGADAPLKGEVLIHAFAKLDDAARTAVLSWQMNGRPMAEVMVSPATWNRLMEAMPDWFKGRPGVAAIPFDAGSGSRDEMAKRAAALAGVPSSRVSVMAAAAAGSTLDAAVDEFVAKGTWCVNFDECYRLVSGDLVKLWAKANGKDAKDVEAMRIPAMARYFNAHASKSPAALFDPDGTRSALFAVWQHLSAGGGDPADMAAALHALDWVPYDARQRKEVIGGSMGEFNNWVANVSKTKDAAAMAPKIAAVREAFRTTMELAQARPELAPTPLCRKVAEVAAAVAAGKADEVAARGDELDAMVRNYEQTRAPFARALTAYLAGLAGKAEPFALQMKMVDDALAVYKPGQANDSLHVTIGALFRARNWGWWNIPGGDKDKALKLNASLAKTVVRLLDQGAYDNMLFDWMRASARGNGWVDTSASDAAMERVIGDRAKAANASLRDQLRPWVLMHVVRHEYAGLAAKYPPERHFDDLFVADAKARRMLDAEYWSYANDSDKKVSDGAAEILQGFARLPFGYGGGQAWDPANFWRWQARALDARPAARDAMIKAVEAAYGQTRFDSLAMGAGYLERQAALDPAAKRAELFARLKAYLDRAAAAPYRVPPPSMVALAGLKSADSLNVDEADLLARVMTEAGRDRWPKNQMFETMAMAVDASLSAQKRDAKLVLLAPHLWKIARDTENLDMERALTRKAQALIKTGQQQVAAAYCIAGQEIMGGRMAEENRLAIMNAKAQSLASLVRSIPVDKTDRRYPAYMAQFAFLTGRTEEAWELYEKNEDLIRGMYRELDPQFVVWIINRHTDQKQFALSEGLAKPMILWMDQNIKSFDPELRGSLYVAYADLSFARKAFPEARAQYERIAATPDFNGTVAQRLAELRIGEVDRLTRNYDKAIDWLEKLAKRQDKLIQTEANYQLALVKYDQAQPKVEGGVPDAGLLKEALGYLDNVFRVDPGHGLGKILDGNINIGLKKFMEATRVQVGLDVNQRLLVPGRPLTVSLSDNNLSVVGRANEIRVAVWTSRGDREEFALLPFGESGTKFQGQIMTEMAPVQKGNGVLQVYGTDEIYYDYTEGFRKQAKISASSVTNVISVAADGELYASSGEIVDKAEQEKRALEEKIRRSIAERTKKPLEEAKTAEAVALSTVRSYDQVRPGNPINVRIVDHDRNVSPEKDTVMLRVAATSGDKIDSLTLTETDTHTGVFEGIIKTDSSEAIAYASDSEEGKDPNFVISPGDYPAWTAAPDNRRPKIFTVDMYDNVALNELSILANVPGRHLKRMILQTSMNGKDYTSVGSYPAMFEGWDGSPRFQVARYVPPADPAAGKPPAQGMPSDAAPIREYLEAGFAVANVPMAYGKHANFNIAWDENVGGLAGRLGFGNDQGLGVYVARFSGGFYVPVRETRTFEIVFSYAPDASGRAGAFLAATLDGVPLVASATARPEPGKPVVMSLTKQLGKGVHRIDVLLAAARGAKPEFALKMDCDEPPFVKACPPDMFDVKKVPEIGLELTTKPVEIQATADLDKFTTTFGEKANARTLRLVILDYETDAPAINRITLNNRDGKQVLPTKRDLLALRKNDILEIVPGDRVTVTYEEPVVISQGKDVHQAFLSATYFNAMLSASFLEVAYEGTEPVETYIPLRRFAPGDVITVFINDPDCDTSAAPDSVTFTMELFGKKPVEMTALETEEHSGTFICRLFPVTNVAEKATEVRVEEGDDILLSYADRENTDPGIPWKRTYAVEQVWYQTPELRVFDTFSHMADTGTIAAARSAAATKQAPQPQQQKAGADATVTSERFIPERELIVRRPILQDLSKPASVLLNGSLIAEIMFPTIAKSPVSTTEVYVQTLSGRKQIGRAKETKPAEAAEAAAPAAATPPAEGAEVPAQPPAAEAKPAPTDAPKPAPAAEAPATVTIEKGFNINVPGTVKRVLRPSGAAAFAVPPGYNTVRVVQPDFKGLDDAAMHKVRKYQTLTDPLGAGLFTLVLPFVLGDAPEAATLEADPTTGELPPLYVKGEDEVYIGYQFVDDVGQTNWLVQTVKLAADKFFDVMDRSYETPVENAYVGETVFYRVLDPMGDLTPEKDEIKVNVKTSSGVSQSVTLVETLKHSGIFKSSTKLNYVGEKPTTQNVEFASFPVRYGDTMAMAYVRPANDASPVERSVFVHKGADGTILPFSKKFKDQDIAVQTQFTLAEAYFELAKRHRKLGQQDLSRKEIAHGKRLLEEALRDFPDVETRVQADYLLANLALEFANDAVNLDVARQYLLEAAAKFSDIVAKNPESTYAPKSQYKKGLVYEKMGEIDQAAEEYVKLSYRYPDNELVAETIARLGQYFLSKGTNLMGQAKETKDPIASEKIRLQAMDVFATSGQVLARLAVRFPSHSLAGKTRVLSGQAFMRGEKYQDAVKSFEWVTKKPEGHNPDLVAEAMFWCGESYMKIAGPNARGGRPDPKTPDPLLAAYKMYKHITWDYPASKWAKFARGRLASPELAAVDRQQR